MPTARLNREMTANILFRHQLRKISFKDTALIFLIFIHQNYSKPEHTTNKKDKKKIFTHYLSKYWTKRLFQEENRNV